MWDLFLSIKTALQTIPDLRSVKIGMETGISAKDTNAARIVSVDSRQSDRNRYFDDGVFQIILLMDLKNDLEQVYQTTFSLETQIRNALLTNRSITYTGSVADQDTVKNFKSSILFFKFTGVRNTLVECPK